MTIRIQYGTGAAVIPARALRLIDRATKTDLKILLFLCAEPALCRPDGGEDALDAVCRKIGCTRVQAENALSFWRGAGVLETDGAPDEADAPEAAARTDGDAAAERGNREDREDREERRPGAPPARPARSDGLPQYTSEDLANLLEERKEAAENINECQRVWGKMFNTHELNILIGLVDYLGLEWEYVLTLLAFCREAQEKTGSGKSLHYVEKTAFAFYDEGVTDLPSLHVKIKQVEAVRDHAARLRAMFGMGNRMMTAREKKLFSTWLYDYRYDMEIIGYAYEITVDRLGKASVNYTNAILARWNEGGLRDIEQIRQAEESFRSAIRSAKRAEAPEADDRASGRKADAAEADPNVERDLSVVRRLLNIGNRLLTSGEIRKFRKWLYEYRFTFEVIFHAYEVTVESQGVLKLPYMDRILDRWHEQGLTSLEAVRAYEQAYREEKARQGAPGRRAGASPDAKGSFQTEDFFQAAVRRSLGEDFEDLAAERPQEQPKGEAHVLQP